MHSCSLEDSNAFFDKFAIENIFISIGGVHGTKCKSTCYFSKVKVPLGSFSNPNNRTLHHGGGGSSIVKVPGDVPPARVYFFGLLV